MSVGCSVFCAVVAFALAPPSYAIDRHQRPKVVAVTPHRKPVGYGPDGTPIATGAPRQLSALAMGGSAWSAYHAMRGKRRQQLANKQQSAIR